MRKAIPLLPQCVFMGSCLVKHSRSLELVTSGEYPGYALCSKSLRAGVCEPGLSTLTPFNVTPGLFRPDHLFDVFLPPPSVASTGDKESNAYS
jgi:hypothetical protein